MLQGDEVALLIHKLDQDLLCCVLAELPLNAIGAAAAVCTRLRDTLRDDEASNLVWKAQLCRRLALPEHATSIAVEHRGASIAAEHHRPARQVTWDLLLRSYHPHPSRIDTERDAEGMIIEGLTARFTGRLGNDRAVRANVAIPTKSTFTAVRTSAGGADGATPRHSLELTRIFFFEVIISEATPPPPAGASGRDDDDDPLWAAEPCISVGLSSRHFPLGAKQTGWDRHSIGYHGDDGFLYHASGGGLRRLGPRFGAGDTIGCGVDLLTRLVFFTHNGTYLGPACRLANLDGEPLYPTVGIDSRWRLALNFGRGAPFKFDVWRAVGLLQLQSRDMYMPCAFADYAMNPPGVHPYGEGSEEDDEYYDEEEEDDEEGEIDGYGGHASGDDDSEDEQLSAAMQAQAQAGLAALGPEEMPAAAEDGDPVVWLEGNGEAPLAHYHY